MELSFDRTAHKEERLAFVRSYAAWVKRTPNAEWSREQAVLIDSLMENARNIPLSPQVYLQRVTGRRQSGTRVPSASHTQVWDRERSSK
ncbi:MAG TPA: hypothetical protein PKM50_01375 [Methanoregula sp.]|nr:hypothetical protein [Methanoregula sp.]